MKKIACILACAMISAASISAYADIPDISELSVDELVQLRDQIDTALFENGGAVELPFGDYVVGRDIAPGIYVIRPHIVEETEDNYGYYYYEMYENVDDDSSLDHNTVDSVQELKITLEEGMLFHIEYYSGPKLALTIEKASALFMD